MSTAKTNTKTVESNENVGALFQALNRNNKTIKRDRAIAIAEDAQLFYKREIEDLNVELRKLLRERQAMLDLSPTDANSLVLASDFDSKVFVNKDIELGIKIRNLSIKLEVANESFKTLFGDGTTDVADLIN